ncbi:Predicted nucleotidyltransferase component of viral defense system [Tangfeifania diversioriginum]|uniref:Predicted nucleotidyltransferase component of viral defense system n=1 Tax=Tangfeifania diversioriginum TaxID=1168035 RepID=A0A1M6MRC8_9BACT|nr:nucleotidyl transferase AbiEii/AbiGii toxin family protein [Tangfeifania diversioriginum]SHJ85843.1 Predicted nucleotidyltransferase component of viral defense system [Tangfeifania diversioriginum]
MIDKKSHTIEWITSLRGRLGKRIDPKLIEKVIYALTFLEQLRQNGLEFVFKGGTALLLATETPKRFSIDIDVITLEHESKIRDILDKICGLDMFIRWEDDNDRKHTPGAPVGHFKMFYKSVVDGREEPVLLDLLYAPNPYPQTREYPLKHSWLATSGENTMVVLPTFEAILGDKLTAFAPKTTGILYSKNRPVEIIKQLYDIAFLFDRITDLDVVRNSYSKVVQEEIGYRNLEINTDEVLKDTRETCYTLVERNLKSDEFNHLQLGIKNFTNFTIERFAIDEAITAAAKVAYLTTLLNNGKNQKIERFKNPLEIREWLIEGQEFNKLNKLKKTNAEAFFYWHKSLSKA